MMKLHLNGKTEDNSFLNHQYETIYIKHINYSLMFN